MANYMQKQWAVNMLKEAFGKEWSGHFYMNFAMWCEYIAKKGYSIGYINAYLNGMIDAEDKNARYLSDNVYKWLQEYIDVKSDVKTKMLKVLEYIHSRSKQIPWLADIEIVDYKGQPTIMEDAPNPVFRINNLHLVDKQYSANIWLMEGNYGTDLLQILLTAIAMLEFDNSYTYKGDE